MSFFRHLLSLSLLSATLAALPMTQRKDPRKEYSNEDIWCLLIAGSNTWMNYRHQADIAHSYHLLRNNGVAEDRIIVMMFDDIAGDAYNPFPGKLYNRPNGPDVYDGLKIDYRNNDVTAENFLAVMRGDEEEMRHKGTGRVIKSSSSSNVFVYYADHGGVDILGMPSGPLLTATQLTSTLSGMKKAGRFHRLVMYIEACESGSMLDNVDQAIEVYGVTASNPSESSWAAYCDGWGGLPCLGDAFSVTWMEDSEMNNPLTFTLEKQFRDVKSLVTSSHVMQYGTKEYVNDVVGEFQGTRRSSAFSSPASKAASSLLWRVQDLPLLHYKQRIGRAEKEEEKEQWREQLKTIMEKRAALHSRMHSLVSSLVPVEQVETVLHEKRGTIKGFSSCHEKSVRYLDDKMRFSESPRLFHYSSTLMNLCASGHSTETIQKAIDTAFQGKTLT